MKEGKQIILKTGC